MFIFSIENCGNIMICLSITCHSHTLILSYFHLFLSLLLSYPSSWLLMYFYHLIPGMFHFFIFYFLLLPAFFAVADSLFIILKMSPVSIFVVSSSSPSLHSLDSFSNAMCFSHSLELREGIHLQIMWKIPGETLLACEEKKRKLTYCWKRERNAEKETKIQGLKVHN